MAYECPVCEVVAPDDRHLAHHLAIVALTRGGDHEAWLDDHAEGWADSEPGEVAAVATEHATAVDHDLVDDHGPGDRDRGRPDVSPPEAESAPGTGPRESPLDDETAAILREARELTARLQDDARGDATAADGAAVPGSDADEEPASDEDADARTDTDE